MPKIWSAAFPISKIRPLRGQKSEGLLGDVFAPDGELLGSFNAHFDAPSGSTEQGDLDRPVGKQLRHGHVRVGTFRGLYDDRFIGSAAEN
jgi:hypothetical protein